MTSHSNDIVWHCAEGLFGRERGKEGEGAGARAGGGLGELTLAELAEGVGEARALGDVVVIHPRVIADRAVLAGVGAWRRGGTSCTGWGSVRATHTTIVRKQDPSVDNPKSSQS